MSRGITRHNIFVTYVTARPSGSDIGNKYYGVIPRDIPSQSVELTRKYSLRPDSVTSSRDLVAYRYSEGEL